MSDTWSDIQAIKTRQNMLTQSLRAKMMERRRQREDIAAGLSNTGVSSSIVPATTQAPVTEQPALAGLSNTLVKSLPSTTVIPAKHQQMKGSAVKVTIDTEVEKKLLMVLCDISLDIPSDSKVMTEHTSRLMEREVDVLLVEELLQKFAAQKLISIKFTEGIDSLVVNSLDLTKLSAMTKGQSRKRKFESDDEEEEDMANKQMKTETGDIESLLSMQSTKEREEKKLNEEIQALLVTQTAKEQLLVEKFKSRGGPQLQEFCQYGTREECHRTGPEGANCKRLHFKKIIHKHTDESLGDCSFLNTCFHMDTCKDSPNVGSNMESTTHQQILSDSELQATSSDWYWDYENNTHLDNLYSCHRQGLYSLSTATNSAMDPIVAQSPYPSTPIPDTSHVSSGSFPSLLARPRIDFDRMCPGNNPNTGNISVDSTRPLNLNVPTDMAARPFPAPFSLNSNADAHHVELIPDPCQSSVPRHIRNVPERPYHHLTGTDATVAPPPLLSEMPCTSSYAYASIPYSHTAPPLAPAALPVTSPHFTQECDMSSFDISVPAVSYTWSLTGNLFPKTISSIQTKSLPKPPKSKNVITNSKKRLRHPEMWKKNLTKSKKLKGEEHISRTGNVIPAKQVEKVDCSSCSFKCQESFCEDLRLRLFDVFYGFGSNESQKQFVCQNVQESATGANRKDGLVENKRKVCRKYFLPDTDNTRKQVCSKFFCRTLAIGKTFITHALRNKQFGCYVGKEKRGKPHNKIPDLLLDPARQHISTMLAEPSEGSKKNSMKKYLDRGLTITQMHEMYKRECSERNRAAVSLSMYRRIIHTEF